MSCQKSTSQLLVKAKTLTANKAGLESAKTKMQSLANTTRANIERANAASCADVITKSKLLTTMATNSPTAKAIATIAKEIANAGSITCSSTEVTSLTVQVTSITASIAIVTVSLETVQTNLQSKYELLQKKFKLCELSFISSSRSDSQLTCNKDCLPNLFAYLVRCLT